MKRKLFQIKETLSTIVNELIQSDIHPNYVTLLREALFTLAAFFGEMSVTKCLVVVVSQILVIFRKGICTGVRHMLTGVLIKRSKKSCFDHK